MNIAVNQSVSQLRTLIAAHVFKKAIPAARVRLFYIDHDSPCGADELKYNGLALHTIGMKDGDQIIVEKKAPIVRRQRTNSDRQGGSGTQRTL